MIHSVTAVLVDMKKLMSAIQKSADVALVTTKVHLEVTDSEFSTNTTELDSMPSIHPQRNLFQILAHLRICKRHIGN